MLRFILLFITCFDFDSLWVWFQNLLTIHICKIVKMKFCFQNSFLHHSESFYFDSKFNFIIFYLFFNHFEKKIFELSDYSFESIQKSFRTFHFNFIFKFKTFELRFFVWFVWFWFFWKLSSFEIFFRFNWNWFWLFVLKTETCFNIILQIKLTSIYFTTIFIFVHIKYWINHELIIWIHFHFLRMFFRKENDFRCSMITKIETRIDFFQIIWSNFVWKIYKQCESVFNRWCSRLNWN